MTQPPENHQQPGGQLNAQPGQQAFPAPGEPLPQDLSAGWLPEDERQKPVSPLPQPRLFAYQSMLPPKVLHAPTSPLRNSVAGRRLRGYRGRLHCAVHGAG